VTVPANRMHPAAPRTSAVICVHSSASSARQWSPLQEALGAGYRVLAPDLLGYGAAPAWHAERPLSLDDEAREIEPLIAAEPDGVHLVGHSYGGAVALHLALRNPGRVKSVSIYEPALFNLLGEDTARRAAAAEISAVRIAVRRVDYWSGLGAWHALPEKRQQGIIARMRKVDSEFDAVFHNPMSLATYRRISVPVLGLLGSVTRRPPREILDLLGTVLPNVTRREIAGAGHLGPLTHTDDVNGRIREFLNSHEVRAPLARAA